LRVSGQFHLITGMLYLFGYRLPETHHLYFLASSFTDFWRRINIYWKDFMMKLVYYPSFFHLRRFGSTMALVAATAIVFLATWLLHSYQWFWLRGGFPLNAQDGLFWGFLAVLVVFGSLREMNRARVRKRGRVARWSLSLALRTAGTFIAICVLWSLWSAESVGLWLLSWDTVTNVTRTDVLLLAALGALGLLIGGFSWPGAEAGEAGFAGLNWAGHARSGGMLLALVALGSTNLYQPVFPHLAGQVASVQRSTLNARDAALQHKGYYENLDNESRMSAQLWEVQASKPAHWIPLGQTEAYRHRDDFLGGELRPNRSIVFLDKPLSTNRWGMRDRERQLEKPVGTSRIAVLGPSHVMGSGVGDDETFTHLLEQRLNEASPNREARYEVFNFGVAAYSLPQQLAAFDQKVKEFRPDVVMVVDSANLASAVVAKLLEAAYKRQEIPSKALAAKVEELGLSALARPGIAVPFDSVRALFAKAGIATRMPWVEAKRRLIRSEDELVQSSFAEVAVRIRSNGAIPVFVALDNVIPAPSTPPRILEQAAAAGFLVFDLFSLWEGKDAAELRIAPWDNHPNARGNRLIAERLDNLLRQHEPELRLGLASSAATAHARTSPK
jgi:hypothetical protein